LLAAFVALSQALATGILVGTTSDMGIGAWILFWGFGGAFAPMLEPLLVTRAFGVRHFGAISGLVAMISFGGQVIGPLGGAFLFDMTGSYSWPFGLYAAGFAISALLWAVSAVLIRGPAHRKRARRNGMLTDSDLPEVSEAT
jgi:MFS family permease